MNRFFSADVEISDVQASYLPEDDLSASDSDAIDSDVEFHLYSQLHYSSSYFEADSQEYNSQSANVEDKSVTSSSDDNVTDNESDDDCDEIDGEQITPKKENEKEEKVGPFKRDDISLLKDYLDQDDEDFVPESWEIVDSVEDDDDEMVDIHIHDSIELVSEDEESEEENTSMGKDCWKIDDKDRQKFKQDCQGRYYSDTPNTRQRCRNCNEVGHLSRNCPEAKKQPVCFICGIRGHLGRECPEKQNLQYSRRHVDCNRCGQQGHMQRECPDIWRQFHATTKIGRIEIPEIPVKVNENMWCFNCASDEHFGEECEEEISCYYPLRSSFVCEYDEQARTYPPSKKPTNSKLNSRRQNETSHSSSSERKSKHKRQHIIFDSSPSESVDHHENHRDQDEYSSFRKVRAQNEQEFYDRHGKNNQRNHTRNHNVSSTKHDKHRTRNESTFHHERRQYDDSEFDHSHKHAKKRKKSPEIIYHNTRKVVLSDPDPPRAKRKFTEFKEPFPRSKKPRTAENFDKKRRYDDRSRKMINRGFQGRYK